jgi:predicted kinase
MSTLTIVRGLPGSGKSTFAKTLKGYKLCEADQFFMIDGIYRFNIKYIKDAHKYCQAKAMYYLVRGENVVVANTFVTVREIVPYKTIAKRYGAILEIITMPNQYGSVHNVPADVVENMKLKWEVFPKKKGE